MRRPVSKLRKLAVAGLASAALLGVGHKAIAKESSQGIKRPAVAEERMERRRTTEFDLNLLRQFAWDWVYLRSFKYLIPNYNKLSPAEKRTILDFVRGTCKDMDPTYMKFRLRQDAIRWANKKFGKYPELLKAVLEGLARNQTFVK